MKYRPIVLLTVVALATSSRADPGPELTPTRAANCVAALKALAEPLAHRLRAGDATVEAQLLPIVMASFAFIGTVYKQGMRSKQANQLLHEAEQAQATLPPDELARRQDACRKEGDQLLSDANFLEREFVRIAARSRIAKLKPR